MKLILSCGGVRVGVLRWPSQLLMNVTFSGVNGTFLNGWVLFSLCWWMPWSKKSYLVIPIALSLHKSKIKDVFDSAADAKTFLGLQEIS